MFPVDRCNRQSEVVKLHFHKANKWEQLINTFFDLHQHILLALNYWMMSTDRLTLDRFAYIMHQVSHRLLDSVKPLCFYFVLTKHVALQDNVQSAYNKYKNWILFDWSVLYSFDFPLYWNILYFFLGYKLFIILGNILYCIVICHRNLSWNFLNNLPLFIINHFPSSRHSLDSLPVLILCNFLLIWNIFYSTIPFN